MTTPLPAVVTILDLPAAPSTAITTAVLFEAVMTVAGIATSVSVSMGQIGSAVVPANTILLVQASTTIGTTIAAVQVSTTTAVTITSPESSAWRTATGGSVFSVFDVSGNASTNNITIVFSNSQRASGTTSLTINADYGGYKLQPLTTGGWVSV